LKRHALRAGDAAGGLFATAHFFVLGVVRRITEGGVVDRNFRCEIHYRVGRVIGEGGMVDTPVICG